MPDYSRRNRRIVIAVVAALAAAAIVVPVLGVLLTPGVLKKQTDTAMLTTTTTTPPPLTIKPLALRPVDGPAYVPQGDDCAPPPPTPPEAPLRTCDILKSAVYQLGPEVLRLQPVDVDSFLNPLTAKQVVQVTMTQESARAFADYTASHIGEQVAFVRADIVVWAPKITEKIDGEVLQLSGEVTAEQAGEIARMLRDEA
ncbi:hypothetical protein ORI20_07875 [Mycobacterium sp. CVI_P3]|uniref:SecDF P1 head subdomain domain-containing protein n=1 Tax=Mycobacterium pinniadriaticum TaxID=2994102 RepID=A0ABT3SB64_9MYCO|nr:hypothetical protein [Mycobacterium pinniadriaticum]MCX2930188.1 hypothetical protein [Mycobacterium pinniadriaticum]MCX2936750.1 hypothetical protein [Mycobacterium pinniadriaticum]